MLPGLVLVQPGNRQTMTKDQVTYLDGVTRFPHPDDTDPMQLLWRLQNEARKPPDGLPALPG